MFSHFLQQSENLTDRVLNAESIAQTDNALTEA